MASVDRAGVVVEWLKQNELEEKLRRVEALYRNPGSDGERIAAATAMRRIQERLSALKKYSQLTVKEYKFAIFTKK